MAKFNSLSRGNSTLKKWKEKLPVIRASLFLPVVLIALLIFMITAQSVAGSSSGNNTNTSLNITVVAPVNNTITNKTTLNFLSVVESSSENRTECEIRIYNATAGGAGNSSNNLLLNQSAGFTGEKYNLTFTFVINEGKYLWEETCSYNNSNNNSGCNSSGNANTTGFAAESTGLLNLTVDVTSPSITLVAPVNNSRLDSGEVNLTFFVQDNYAAVINCTLLLNSTLNSSAPLIREDNISAETWGVVKKVEENIPANSSSSWSVSCRDMAGNEGKSQLWSFTTISLNNSTQGNATNQSANQTANLTFELYADKPVYYTDEQVDITVLADVNSLLNMTITNLNDTGFLINFATIIIYPTTSFFRYFNESGEYVVNATLTKGAAHKDKSTQFRVIKRNTTAQPNLQVSISASDTEIGAGEEVKFKCEATNYINDYTCIWDLNGDGTPDSTSKETSYTYASAGGYTVKVMAESQNMEANDSVKIIVKPKYTLNVKVINNRTEQPIEGAVVMVNGNAGATNKNGDVSFSVIEGDAVIKVDKNNYYEHVSSESIAQDKSITIRLASKEKDIVPPSISLTAPEDNYRINATAQEEPLEVEFFVSDDSDVNCTVFYSRYNGYWENRTEIKAAVNSGNKAHITVYNGTNYWMVNCTDEFSNSALSPARKVSVVLNAAASGQKANNTNRSNTTFMLANNLINEIEKHLLSVKGYAGDDKSLADSIGMLKELDAQKTELIKLRRDAFNTRFLKSEEEKKRKELEVRNDIIRIRNSTIVEINVQDKRSFVKYPSPEEVGKIAGEYLSARGINMTNKSLGEYASENVPLQDLLTISTTAWKAEVLMLNNERREITIIRHTIKMENSTVPYDLVISIPKDIIPSADVISFKTLFEIIKNDPLVRVVPDRGEVIYYFDKEVELGKLQKIGIVALSRNINIKQKITGFSIAGITNITSNWKMVAELLAILILGGVLVSGRIGLGMNSGRTLHHVEGIRKGTHLGARRKEKEPLIPSFMSGMKGVFLMADSALNRRKGDAERLSTNYEHIRRIYAKSPPPIKRMLAREAGRIAFTINREKIEELLYHGRVFTGSGNIVRARETYDKLRRVISRSDVRTRRMFKEEIAEFYNDINTLYTQKLLLEANRDVEEGKITKAKGIYRKIQKCYPFLSSEQKQELYKKASELFLRIKERERVSH